MPDSKAFEYSLSREITLAQRRRGPLCVVLCEADQFTQIRGEQGDLVGSDVMQSIATLLISGLDENMNGELDSDEILSVSVLCHGVDGADGADGESSSGCNIAGGNDFSLGTLLLLMVGAASRRRPRRRCSMDQY